MELFKLLFALSLICITQSASIVKSIDNSDDIQVAVPATYIYEELSQNSEKENDAVQKDVPKESEDLDKLEKEITKIQQNNAELRPNQQSNGEIHIPVAIVETPISVPAPAVQPEVATSDNVREPTPQSDAVDPSTAGGTAPPAPLNESPPPSTVQQGGAQQNIFQQIYTGVTNALYAGVENAFQKSINRLAEILFEYYSNLDFSSPSGKDNVVIEQGLKKLKGTLQQGLKRLNRTYEAYVKLNHKNKPGETMPQDVADSQLFENQLRDLQKQIVDGTRNVEESIKSINSVGKAEETTPAPSNPGGIFQQAISNFQHGVQQSLQNINNTFQGFINRGQGDTGATQGDAATVRPPGIIQQGLQNLQQGFQQGFQNFQNLVRPQGAQSGTQSEETSSNRPNIFQQGFQNLQQGFQNLITRPGSQPAANTETGTKGSTTIKEKAENSPEIPKKSPDASEKQEQSEDENAEKVESVNETPIAE